MKLRGRWEGNRERWIAYEQGRGPKPIGQSHLMESAMKLNLGCGHDHREGFLNIDASALVEPDQVVDLDDLPLPWDDSSVDEILIKHTLEHLGQTPAAYISLMKEFWRICRPGAVMTIVVPHHRHDHFISDPTHVRAITPAGLELFSQKRNREWIDKGLGNSPLGITYGIDFELISVDYVPSEPWRGRLERKEMDTRELAEAAQTLNNVIVETTIKIKAVKDGGE